MAKSPTSYRPAMIRTSVVFVLLIVLAWTTTGAFLLAGLRTQVFKRAFVEPVQSWVADKQYALEEEAKKPAATPVNKTDLFAEFEKKPTIAPRKIIQPPKTAVYQSPQRAVQSDAYQEAIRQQEEWWKSVRAQNRQMSLESQKQLEDFRAQSQKNMDEFRKQGEQGWIDFEKKYGY